VTELFDVAGSLDEPGSQRFWLNGSADLQEVHDPLWFLTRQWQLGEFEGEDAGSPIDVRVEYDHDMLSGYDLDGSTRTYEGEPLEALVESEPMLVGEPDGPRTRLRVETGMTYLRFLRDEGFTRDALAGVEGEGSFGASSFPPPLLVEPPDEPMDTAAQRFTDLVGGDPDTAGDNRAVDGYEVYERCARAQRNGWSSVGDPPLPDDVGANAAADDAFQRAAGRYYEWYRDLYVEPTEETGSAWDPSRMEYSFDVSTGTPDTDETVFAAEEYPGGRLDWYHFDVGDGSLDADMPAETAQRSGDLATMPTKVRFPGMPANRWWEFEEGDLQLDDIVAGAEELSRMLFVEFAVLFGNDWFTFPLRVPVGSLTRLTEFEVVDTFGETTDVDPVTDDPDWQMFMHEDVAGGEGGLFVPPSLTDHHESDPVERVYLARDEMANVAFAVERLVEDAVGDTVDRTEFQPPRLTFEEVYAGGDVADERVVLHNPGEDHLDVGDWTVEDADGTVVYRFDGNASLDPGESVTIHTDPADAPEGKRHAPADLATPVWPDGGAVSVTRPRRDGSGRHLVATELLSTPQESYADWKLASDVPDHWYPLKPSRPELGAGTVPRAYQFELAILLDASTLDAERWELPRPHGEILEPHVADPSSHSIPEEEVTRAGTEVTRTYQYARWTDGSAALWSGRRASTGRGGAASGLRFDTLEEPDRGGAAGSAGSDRSGESGSDD
jgi:hypothetical protein